MTPKQRIAAAVAGGMAALFVLALLIAALVGDDGDDELVADATTTTASSVVEETTTSTGVEEPTTTTAAPTSTTALATTTTAARPVLNGQGAVLRTPASPIRRTIRQGGGCTQFATPGWTAECVGIRSDWYLVIESKAAAGGATARRAYTYRQETGETWIAAAEARDDDGSRFTEIRFRGEDIGGDAAQEAIFGFRRTGSTRMLAVDVVQFPGNVVVHRESPDGSARVSPGQLDLWEAAGTQYDHLTVRFVDNAWRIVASTKVNKSAVPPSHF
ncbi:MAG TPA: hypothetical protein VM938_08630 [Acidimicrobiales bacterium]|nr:hypothetical protein [Acidimicrobiales bacterium]